MVAKQGNTRLSFIFIAMFACFTLSVEAKEKPPKRTTKIVGEIAAGGVGAFVGGWGVGRVLLDQLPGKEEIAVAAGSIGAILGSSAGVYIVGTWDSRKGEIPKKQQDYRKLY